VPWRRRYSGLAQTRAGVEQLASDHAGIRPRPQAHRQIDAFGDQVEIAVAQDKLDRQRRKRLAERGKQGRDATLAERHRCGDPQRPLRLAADVAGRQPRPRQLLDQRLDPFEIDHARLRRRQPPRRALEQAHAERLFQRRHGARHGGRIGAAVARHGGEPAAPHDGNEGFQNGDVH